MINEQSQYLPLKQSQQHLQQLYPKQQQQQPPPFQPYNSIDNLASLCQPPSLPSSPVASKNISAITNNITLLNSQPSPPPPFPSFPSSNHWVPLSELSNPKHNTSINNSSKISQSSKKYGSNIAESLTRQQNIRVIQDINVKQLRLAFDCSNKMYIMDARMPIQISVNSGDEQAKEQHDLLGMSRRKHAQSIISKEKDEKYEWNINDNEELNYQQYQQQQLSSTQSSSMKQQQLSSLQSPGYPAAKKQSNASSTDGISINKSSSIPTQKYQQQYINTKVSSGKASILHYLGNINDAKTNEYLKAAATTTTSSQWSSSQSVSSSAANIPLVQMRRTLFKYTNNRKIPGISLPCDEYSKMQLAKDQYKKEGCQQQHQQQQQYHLMQSSYAGGGSRNKHTYQGSQQSQPVVMNKSNSSQSQYSSLIASLIDTHDQNIAEKTMISRGSPNQRKFKKYLYQNNYNNTSSYNNNNNNNNTSSNNNSQSQLPLIPAKTTTANHTTAAGSSMMSSTQRRSFVEDTLKAYSVKHFCDDFNKIPLALRKQYYLSQDASKSNQVFFLGGAKAEQQQQQQQTNDVKNMNNTQNRTAYLTTNGKYGFFTMKQTVNTEGGADSGSEQGKRKGGQVDQQSGSLLQHQQQQQQYQQSSQAGLITIENQQQMSQRQQRLPAGQSEQLLLQSSQSSLDRGQISVRMQRDISSGAYDLGGISQQPSQKNPPSSHANLDELLGPQDDMQRYMQYSQRQVGDVKISQVAQEGKEAREDNIADNKQHQIEQQLHGQEKEVENQLRDQENQKKNSSQLDEEKNVIHTNDSKAIAESDDNKITREKATGNQPKQMQIQLKQLHFEQRNTNMQHATTDGNDINYNNNNQAIHSHNNIINSSIKTARESQSIEKQQFLLSQQQQRLVLRKHSEGIFNASSSNKAKSIPDISGWIASTTSQQEQLLGNNKLKKNSKIKEQITGEHNSKQVEIGNVNRANTMNMIAAGTVTTTAGGGINSNMVLLKQQPSVSLKEQDIGNTSNINSNINNDEDQDLKEYLSLMNKSKEQQQQQQTNN